MCLKGIQHKHVYIHMYTHALCEYSLTNPILPLLGLVSVTITLCIVIASDSQVRKLYHFKIYKKRCLCRVKKRTLLQKKVYCELSGYFHEAFVLNLNI